MRLNLARDYVFHLKQNTADLSRTVLIGAEEIVRGVLLPIMRAMLHGVIALFLMALLVLINLLADGVVLLFRGDSPAAWRARGGTATSGWPVKPSAASRSGSWSRRWFSRRSPASAWSWPARRSPRC